MVLAAAFAGQTQATTYNTSDYAGKSLTLLQKTDNVIIVDSSDSLSSISADKCDATFIFEGSHQLVCSGDCYFRNGSNLNLTATASAAEHWIDVFSQESGGMVTLAPRFNQLSPGSVSIEGIAEGGTVTLVGTSQQASFTYVGRKTGLDKINEGEIAWLNEYNTTSLNLIAKLKGSPVPVPEPTPGTLSLLALAGLCMRRRK